MKSGLRKAWHSVLVEWKEAASFGDLEGEKGLYATHYYSTNINIES